MRRGLAACGVTLATLALAPTSQAWARALQPEDLHNVPAVAAARHDPKVVEYVVASNDTLSSIAQRFDTNLFALVSQNKIGNPNLITVGQHLMIVVGSHPAGTVAFPKPVPTAPRQVSQQTAPILPGGVWQALGACESGNNPADNTGNGFYGAFQFELSTWQAMGGVGLPSDASYAEQEALAQKLQAIAGWGQWPACSAKLGL